MRLRAALKHSCVRLVPGYGKLAEMLEENLDKLILTGRMAWEVTSERAAEYKRQIEKAVKKMFFEGREKAIQVWKKLSAEVVQISQKAGLHMAGLGLTFYEMIRGFVEVPWEEWWETIKQVGVSILWPWTEVSDQTQQIVKNIGTVYNHFWNWRPDQFNPEDKAQNALVDAWGNMNAILAVSGGWLGFVILAVSSIVGAVTGASVSFGALTAHGGAAGFLLGLELNAKIGLGVALSSVAQQLAKARFAMATLFGSELANPHGNGAAGDDDALGEARNLVGGQNLLAEVDAAPVNADGPALDEEDNGLIKTAKEFKEPDKVSAAWLFIVSAAFAVGLLAAMFYFGASAAKLAGKLVGRLVRWFKGTRLYSWLQRQLGRFSASKGKPKITIKARDGDVILGEIDLGDTKVAFTANESVEGGVLTLDKLHIQEAGGASIQNQLGYPRLKEAAKAYGRQKGVNEVVIQGGARAQKTVTTPSGKTVVKPARIPTPIRIIVD